MAELAGRESPFLLLLQNAFNGLPFLRCSFLGGILKCRGFCIMTRWKNDRYLFVLIVFEVHDHSVEKMKLGSRTSLFGACKLYLTIIYALYEKIFGPKAIHDKYLIN